ncbi:unnamed protein product [Symbiodinium sp. CCMP2592]|nr:unnamed protein product [Symbiodinium sp. CCMP2592]
MGNTAQCRCHEQDEEHDVDGDILGEATALSLHYIYDLNDEWLQSNQISADILNIGGTGISTGVRGAFLRHLTSAFHAGVEVHGKEWSFGQDGIDCQEPRTHDVHVYRMSIAMGRTSQAEAEVVRFMDLAMRSQWHGCDYDMLERNCCSFAEVVCMHLVGRNLPGWVTRFPRLACTASQGVNHLINVAEQLAAEQAHKLPCIPARSTDALPNAEEHHPSDQFSEEEVEFNEDNLPKVVVSQPPICHVHSVISRATTTMVSEASELALHTGLHGQKMQASASKLGPSQLVLELVALQTDSDFYSVHRLRAFSHAS